MNEITSKELAANSNLGGNASFLANVAAQDREDIKLANLMVQQQVLQAQRSGEAMHWFDNYQLKLQALARPATEEGFDPAVFQMIAQAGQAGSIITQWALQSLTEHMQGLQLFQSRVQHERKRYVQLLPCVTQANGCILLILHYLEVDVTHSSRGVLSLRTKRDDNSLSERVAAITFDPAVFRDAHRQRVLLQISEHNRQMLQQVKLGR